MTVSSTWKSIFDDLANTYYDSKTKGKHSANEDPHYNAKIIAILVITTFFAFVIVCLLLAVLVKWMRKRKSRDENHNGKSQLSPAKNSPRYVRTDGPSRMGFMRSDSSLSDIDVSRDSSLPPTPLSPLSEEDSSMFPFERGRLEFSVSYDQESECLKATVIQAHGLPQRHCIFYVEILLFPDRNTKQQTSIRYHNPSPIFEEAFEFDLPFAELPERTLCFKVVEFDGFSQHQVVGHVLYSFDVESSNYLKPMKMTLDLCSGLPQDKTDKEHVGEVLMSLCYLPTAGRLTLVILKCRLYKASVNSGLPSPYLKVSLMLNRKQVKKIKTSIKRKTLNPVYNEAFIFDVPTQHISNVSLYARVVNDREDQELMGKVVIGRSSRSGMGLHHWDCMLMSPRKPIAQWHVIT